MTDQNRIFKCGECGHVVEAVHFGKGMINCCGKEMELLKEKTEDEGKEKHVPVIEKTENGVLVKVGSVEHPMEEQHYIAWIEVIADGNSYRKFLKPGDKPQAEFCVKADKLAAKEYCTVHELWKSEA